MDNTKTPESGRLFIARSGHCTSFGVANWMVFPKFLLPSDLYKALQDGLEEREGNSERCRSYIKCLKSLSNVNKISPMHYLFLFKIFLYMEGFERQRIAKKHNTLIYKISHIYEGNCFNINVFNLENNKNCIDIGDEVKIKNPQTGKKYFGKVVDVVGICLTVQLRKAVKLQNDDNNFWEFLTKEPHIITFLPSEFPIKCYHYAINMIYKCNAVNLLYPQINTTLYTLPKNNLNYIQKTVAENYEQKQAVLNIVNKSAHPAPYILFGPPGTGKTTTLVEAVYQIWKRSQSEYVLICAASNASVDVITKRLLEFIPAKDIYRMYTKSCKMVPQEIDPCSNIIDNQVIFLPKKILLLKRIVIATLVTSIRLVPLKLRHDHFSYIFIDEASQTVEPDALIPIILGIDDSTTNNCTIHPQVVICGDPYQLGPIVMCKLIQHLYGKSFIERLMDCEPYQKVNGRYDPRYITKLTKNFRSRKAILHVPNKLFYECELEACADSNLKSNILRWPEIRNKTFPIIFCSVKGEEVRSKGGSVYNVAELVAVSYYVKKLLRTKINQRQITEHDIGIITPFKQQESLIRKNLLNDDITNVDTGTVEVFQGQEKNIIIFSSARTHSFVHDNKEHIGFLSNPKRFNVAVTRAKMFLIIIGNEDILHTDNCWKEFIEYCAANNACITMDPEVLKEKEIRTKIYSTIQP